MVRLSWLISVKAFPTSSVSPDSLNNFLMVPSDGNSVMPCGSLDAILNAVKASICSLHDIADESVATPEGNRDSKLAQNFCGTNQSTQIIYQIPIHKS